MKNVLPIAFLAVTLALASGAYAQSTSDNTDVQETSNTNLNDNTANDVLSATSITWIQKNGSNLLVYPNPAINNTRIVLAEPSVNNVYVDLINLNGSVVRSYQYGAGSYQLDLDLGNVPVGVYSARVSSSGMVPQSVKILKH